MGHVRSLQLKLTRGGVYARRASVLGHTEVSVALEELKSIIRDPGKSTETLLGSNPLYAAIEVASESLWKAISERQRSGHGDTIALSRAVERYARRVRYRATPFGLFAGVGVVQAPDRTIESNLLGPLQYTVVVSAGNETRDPTVSVDLESRWIVANLAVVVTGDEAVLREVCLTERYVSPHKQAFRMPPVLETVWEKCRRGKWFEDLAQILFQTHGVARNDVDRIVALMVEKQLLFALREPLSMPELIGRTARVTRPGSRNVRHLNLPPSAPPPGVSRNVEGVATRLFQFKQFSGIGSARQEYSNRFVDRFGVGIRVPYRRAVDDIKGVGLIDFANTGLPKETHSDASEELLEDFVIRARAADTTEIFISDDEVESLIDPARRALGIDTDVLYAVHAQSGRVELAATPCTALPGQAVVRHWEQLPGSWFETARRTTDIVGRAVEPVELWCLPRSRQILDVMHAPHVTDRYISLSFADPTDACITIDEIDLIHDGSQVWLLAKGSNIPLVIRNLSMVNFPKHLSQDAQTLMTIGREIEREWAPFSWGKQSARDFLPGVVYRDILISKARWRVPARLFRKDLATAVWCHEFERWRDAMSLPQWMDFGGGDNILPFDTTDSSEFQEIRRTLQKDSPVAFESGRVIDNQLAIEYVQHVSRPSGVDAEAIPDFSSAPNYAQPDVRRDWLAFELVGAADSAWQPEATRRLVAFSRSLGIEDWHFVVYNDPDPHTRLRFHSEGYDDRSIGLIREAAIREVGLSVRNIREVPFLPEYQRYGGEECFDLIAPLFTKSSLAALGASVELQEGATRLENACLTAIESMERLFGSEWSHVVGPALATHKPPRVRKRDRSEVLARLPIRVVFGGEPVLADASSLSRPAGIAMSVLHMHANRMFAADRDGEMQMLSVLKNYVSRQQFASGR